jgi:hypothetical protein
VYVIAPLGVSVEQKVRQMAVGLAATVIVGFGLTVTSTVLVPAQPPVLPVTVYVVVIVGVTVTGLPPSEPGIHKYDVAPVPVSTAEAPLHIVAGEADAPTVGTGTTVMVMVLVPIQPLLLTPLTV